MGGGGQARSRVGPSLKSIPSNQTVDSEPNRRVQRASVGVSACVAGFGCHPAACFPFSSEEQPGHLVCMSRFKI